MDDAVRLGKLLHLVYWCINYFLIISFFKTIFQEISRNCRNQSICLSRWIIAKLVALLVDSQGYIVQLAFVRIHQQLFSFSLLAQHIVVASSPSHFVSLASSLLCHLPPNLCKNTEAAPPASVIMATTEIHYWWLHLLYFCMIALWYPFKSVSTVSS